MALKKFITADLKKSLCIAACLLSVIFYLTTPQAVARSGGKFSEFYRISVDALPVHTGASEDAPSYFQLLRGMEIEPVGSAQAEGFLWFEIKINGRSFWLKYKDVSKHETYADTTYERPEEEFFKLSTSDKKILVNKELRTLTLYEKNDDGWKEKKRYHTGLGDFTGKRQSSRLTYEPQVYLVLMKGGGFKMYEKLLAKFPDAGESTAIVFLDKTANEITVYEVAHGKWIKRDERYRSDEKIIFSSTLVWFYDDKFNILYHNDLSPKRIKGDRRTPEGLYYIADINPVSRYGKDPDTKRGLPSLQLSYPNNMDAWRGLRSGLITISQYNQITEAIENTEVPPQNTPLGSLIMIHGGGEADWTAGCVALNNRDMKELASEVDLLTPVYIK
ncbi:MAG: L,D-transpeptidase [Nitrospirae bacterium YQR-1]